MQYFLGSRTRDVQMLALEVILAGEFKNEKERNEKNYCRFSSNRIAVVGEN
jgi:hypothetical protein